MGFRTARAFITGSILGIVAGLAILPAAMPEIRNDLCRKGRRIYKRAKSTMGNMF